MILVLLLIGTGIAVSGVIGGRAETMRVGEGRVEIGDLTNDPIISKSIVLTTDSPLGTLVVETYESDLGACADLIIPARPPDAVCLMGSGVDPDKPVTGNPTTGSIQAINGPAWNAGLTEPGMGMLHHGLAHPSVAKVMIEPADGAASIEAMLAQPTDLGGVGVFLIWTPPGIDRYVLAAYDQNGCLLQASPMSLTAVAPGPPGFAVSCGA